MPLTSFETRRSNGPLCDTARLQRTMGIAEVARDDADINSAGYSAEFVRSFFALAIYLPIQFLLHKYLYGN